MPGAAAHWDRERWSGCYSRHVGVVPWWWSTAWALLHIGNGNSGAAIVVVTSRLLSSSLSLSHGGHQHGRCCTLGVAVIVVVVTTWWWWSVWVLLHVQWEGWSDCHNHHVQVIVGIVIPR